MTQLFVNQDFKDLLFYIKRNKKVKSLKELAEISGYNYTYLSQIMARECHIDTKFTRQEIVKNAPVQIQYFKWELMTSHTARRTFAGLRLNSGWKLRDIQMALGH